MKKKFEPADFSRLTTYSIKKRTSVVDRSKFVDISLHKKSNTLTDLFPDLLKSADLLKLVSAIKNANQKGKPVLLGMGAHVIKCGLSTIIIEMMRKGFIDAVALNGAGAVHDTEIAFHGATSEIVAVEIKEGRFGMVEETGAHINKALANAGKDEGFGEALGRYMAEQKFPNLDLSILANGYKLGVPVTVHAAIGTDIVHFHPSINGEDTGRATLNDFKLFTGIVGELGNGGVYLNVGSAVLLPEVFIKALSAARNLGHDVTGFTTANFDMLQHYRPGVNVVSRPIQGEGDGFAITGHHEIMIPLVYHLLTQDKR